jgi:hypothetical protein
MAFEALTLNSLAKRTALCGERTGMPCLARGLMQVRHAAAAAGAAHALAQLDRRKVLPVTGDEIRWEEHAAVLASPADGDERRLCGDQLPKGAADSGLAGIAVAGAHLVRKLHWQQPDKEAPPANSGPPGGKRGAAARGLQEAWGRLYQDRNKKGTPLTRSCGDAPEPAGIASRGSRGGP